jgi:DNA-directed RNA polymerase sigma subunit (sigma70/sigma32)
MVSGIRLVLAERLGSGASYADVAREFEVTRERVRQIAKEMGLRSQEAERYPHRNPAKPLDACR